MSGEIDEITRAHRMAQRARADAFKLPTIDEMRPIVEAWETLPGMPYPSTMTTAQWRAVLVGDDICAQMREVVGAADRLADMMREASAPEGAQ